MTTPIAPPLDAELERLLKRMRLPDIRRAAPEVLATAKAQRWDPIGVLKAVLAEDVAGQAAALAIRRTRAAFPTKHDLAIGSMLSAHPRGCSHRWPLRHSVVSAVRQ